MNTLNLKAALVSLLLLLAFLGIWFVATLPAGGPAASTAGLTPEQVEQRMGLITPTLEYAALKDADLIVEAVFEEMGVKEAVFRQLDAVAKPGAILASNTSYLDIDRIATQLETFIEEFTNILQRNATQPAAR